MTTEQLPILKPLKEPLNPSETLQWYQNLYVKLQETKDFEFLTQIPFSQITERVTALITDEEPTAAASLLASWLKNTEGPKGFAGHCATPLSKCNVLLEFLSFERLTQYLELFLSLGLQEEVNTVLDHFLPAGNPKIVADVAAREGHLEVVKFLLGKHYGRLISCGQTKEIVSEAAMGGQHKVIDYLLWFIIKYSQTQWPEKTIDLAAFWAGTYHHPETACYLSSLKAQDFIRDNLEIVYV